MTTFKPILSEDPKALEGAYEWADKELARMEKEFVSILRVLLKIQLIDSRNDLMTYRYVGASKRNICCIVRYSIFPWVILSVLLAIPLAMFLIPGLFDGIVHDLGLQRVPLYPSLANIMLGAILIVFSAHGALGKKAILSGINEQ